MPKEYDSIKKQLKTKSPEMAEEILDDKANKVFKAIYELDVKEANELTENGEWDSYLKNHSTKELVNSKVKYDNLYLPADIFAQKEADGNYYIYGFVSADTIDTYNDLVPDQSKLVDKLNSDGLYSKYLSYHHGWLQGDLNDVKPLGVRTGKASLKLNPKTNTECAYLGYKLNKTHPKYKDAIYEVEESFANGFSIEFDATDYHYEVIGDTKVRVLDDYKLGGVGLASRPVQEDAIITNYFAKSYEYLGGKNMDDLESKEKKIKTKVSDVQTPVDSDAKVIADKDSDNKDIKVDDQKVEEEDKEVKKVPLSDHPSDVNDAEFKELRMALESKEKEIEAFKLQVKELNAVKELAEVKDEFEKLKAEKKVLVREGDEFLTDSDPKEEASKEENDKLDKIMENKELNFQQKAAKLAEIEFSNLE